MEEEKFNNFVKVFFENRGVSHENVNDFLFPDFEKGLFNPFLFKDMEKAVARIYKAIISHENILIYTDYDCDGIPAAVILYDFFKKIEESSGIKINFENYIPHRHNEGYGLHKNVLERYIRNGFTLMITADLGITNIEEVQFAEENGMNVILTDHHLPTHKLENGELLEQIPKAYCVINTQVKGETYPNKNICGAATAWKLVNAFLVKYGEEFKVQSGWEKWLLDMVCLATVADMMELTGENRVLVHYGLKVFAKSKRESIKTILKIDKIKQNEITETDLSFSFAPRVNAAGRLDHPFKAFEAFSNINDLGGIKTLEIDKINKNRKEKVKEINEIVLKDLVSHEKDISSNNLIFIGNNDWSPGIVGLVAQKIVEETGKTAFVWGLDESGIVRGSSRSGLDRINVTDLTASISHEILHFGGHEFAGGFSFENGKQKTVSDLLELNYLKLPKKQTEDTSLDGVVNIVDMEVNGREVNYNFYMSLRKLSPFGIGNLAPVFKIKGKLEKVREFGKNKEHIELTVDGLSLIKFFVNKNFY
jgi:single-stranded-DNA-specific exonuclease